MTDVVAEFYAPLSQKLEVAEQQAQSSNHQPSQPMKFARNAVSPCLSR
jgi:hypothetical protein